MTRRPNIPPRLVAALRWAFGLSLPGLLLALGGLAILRYESQHHSIAVRLGQYLLQRNPQQAQSGAVWEGILGARRSRVQLQERAGGDSAAAPPPVVLGTRYRRSVHTADYTVLDARPRTRPLRPDTLSAAHLSRLAASIQFYRQGSDLLAVAVLPDHTVDAKARIHAEIALDDGRLFPLLHRRLAVLQVARAWDFVRMSAPDQRQWRQRLRPLIAAYGHPGRADSSAVARALNGQLDAWRDSLHAAERSRLKQLWDEGTACQIRLLRHMDGFRGYFQPAGEAALGFEVPPAKAIIAQRLLALPEVAP